MCTNCVFYEKLFTIMINLRLKNWHRIQTILTATATMDQLWSCFFNPHHCTSVLNHKGNKGKAHRVYLTWFNHSAEATIFLSKEDHTRLHMETKGSLQGNIDWIMQAFSSIRKVDYPAKPGKRKWWIWWNKHSLALSVARAQSKTSESIFL